MPARGHRDADEVRADGGHLTLDHQAARKCQADGVPLVLGFAEHGTPAQAGGNGLAIEAG